MTTHAELGVERRVAMLEAENAIRRVLATYMALCDSLGPDTPMDALAALFTVDAEWCGTGARYAAAFGDHIGRDAIIDMLARYRGPPAHFAMNAHFLASESIRVHEDTAEGSWMMLQCSTYADGSSDLRSARLSVGFAIEEADWRIARFATENLFSRKVDSWMDNAPIRTPHS